MLPLPALIAVLVVGAAALALSRLRNRSMTGTGRWLRRILMLALVCLMLARPEMPVQGAQVSAPAADVFFVVDTTASMSAEDDIEGSTRLAGVQRDIVALVDELAGADFAMITFDSVVALRVPLTHDAAAVLTATTTLRPEVSERSLGSSVGAAAETLHSQLEASAAASPNRARVVYYFGDGEQTVARSVESFGASAALIGGGAVFGYGTAAGGSMRVGSLDSADAGEMILDPRTGEAALSRTDEETMNVIAAELAVDYRHRADSSAVSAGDLRLSVVQHDGSLNRTATTGLYWLPALLLLTLLVWELNLLGLALAGTRPRRPRR